LSRSAGNDDRDALKVGELFAPVRYANARMTTPSQARWTSRPVEPAAPINVKV
jgi:hypothetical protein